jgi:hypothetical protein
MRFILIAAPGDRMTDRQLEAACAARKLAFVKVVPGSTAAHDFGLSGERRLIYRTGVSLACVTLEKLVYRAGDAILHDPYFYYGNQQLIFELAGLPRPSTLYLPQRDPSALARQVEGLGGWPVVVKIPGTEGGKGVSLVHDLTALEASLAAAPAPASVEAYFPHARCWRVTVLNGRALAATARIAGAGDFRTNGPGSVPIEHDTPPTGLGEIAVRAAQVLKLEFGGADIMEAEDGTLQIAEFNFPCYFAEQQELTGIDIAGAIVDRLIEMGPHPTAGIW